jgi:hypothetical protein
MSKAFIVITCIGVCSSRLVAGPAIQIGRVSSSVELRSELLSPAPLAASDYRLVQDLPAMLGNLQIATRVERPTPPDLDAPRGVAASRASLWRSGDTTAFEAGTYVQTEVGMTDPTGTGVHAVSWAILDEQFSISVSESGEIDLNLWYQSVGGGAPTYRPLARGTFSLISSRQGTIFHRDFEGLGIYGDLYGPYSAGAIRVEVLANETLTLSLRSEVRADVSAAEDGWGSGVAVNWRVTSVPAPSAIVLPGVLAIATLSRRRR